LKALNVFPLLRGPEAQRQVVGEFGGFFHHYPHTWADSLS
jgi:hypothetical protein